MSLIEDIAYDHSQGRHQYRGLVLTNSEFQYYLKNEVNKKFYDVEGALNLQKMFKDVAPVGFNSGILKFMFGSEEIPIDWKIGEKIAECFLEDFCYSVFPYNDSRDAKDSNASLPGSDIVGFVKIDGKALFLFGEVKTSDQERYPPSVVTDRKNGLKNQLNEIKNRPKKRRELIRWLGHKISPLADDHAHKIAWQQATLSYLDMEFKIFGVLIRGVTPDKRDLESAFTNIVLNLKNETYLELLSLYLPVLKSQYAGAMGGQQ